MYSHKYKKLKKKQVICNNMQSTTMKHCGIKLKTLETTLLTFT